MELINLEVWPAGVEGDKPGFPIAFAEKQERVAVVVGQGVVRREEGLAQG